MADATVIKRVKAALAEDPRIKLHSHPILVDLDADGALVLEGEVPTIAAKKLALSHAARVSGAVGIVDRLRVEPSRRMSEGEIREHVRDALLEEPALDRCAIRIDDRGSQLVCRAAPPGSNCGIDIRVEDGVVTLDGQVDSLSLKRLAGALAWWVPGTRDVINGLEVSPEEQDSDDEIAEAVKLVLERDPLVNGDRIRVRSRDGVVTLEGMVANEKESEMAETDAWCLVGVERVENRLETSR